jgi:hypothetical protein
MRPSERATQAVINRDKEEKEFIKGGLKTVAGLGLSASSFALGSKILPFLSKHIPADLVVKGINKISPELGSFLKKGMDAGLNIEEGKQFLKDKLQPKENAQDNRNIIEQYSPELHQFIEGEIQKGRQPLEAGALAQLKKEFADPIKKLTKDHKAPFSALLQTVYGGGQQSQQGQQQPQPQQPQQGQPQNQQSGQGQQALMAIMQKINQTLGG